ncbi:Emp24/gp25L/p24 family protein [Haematococcus lacustris]|nr:hypothetical protein QJQ45_029088 [Haematococcus lacustris]
MQTFLLLFLLASGASALKLKIRYEECMTYDMLMYEPFYGSFVALPDTYGVHPSFILEITAPSGTKVHNSGRQTESKFHQVPYETGRYRFCLTVSELHHSARYTLPREVVWDLHLGHAGVSGEHVHEHDTTSLWHYVNQVDQQLQQLRATQTYIYWRERRHRQTVDSTNKRVLWYAIARAAALVTVSVVQVLGVRYMFRSK